MVVGEAGAGGQSLPWNQAALGVRHVSWGKGVSLSVPHFLPSEVAVGHGLVRINSVATSKVLVQGQGYMISAVVIT